ncbi:histamine H2 receptor-like [Orbicella faveolata]|uniref:histamine H2 receptor-like n=1 Tax=Orbicella faveolata TaxID=48498 RepID=UPI0009E1CC66|nr:histamine H2 receptor-like [Orbicella faveolata]
MAYNLSGSNFNNFTNISTEGGTPNNPPEVHLIITIIINIMTSPVTVLLNVLVIMAVKKITRLQSYPNILLACLAATDVLTGLIVQPSFILCRTFQLLGMNETEMILCTFHYSSIHALSLCSCLHLMLITCERLIAIKFTLRYTAIVTTRRIKVAVITFWIVSLISGVTRDLENKTLLAFSLAIYIFCVLFIVFSYLILYREILRHRKMIKAHQLPQEEVERFAKEHKALKTTVIVIGAVVLCFVPVVFVLVLGGLGLAPSALVSYVATFVTFNSLLNPLIYCGRQEEMRKFAFRFKSEAVVAIR